MSLQNVNVGIKMAFSTPIELQQNYQHEESVLHSSQGCKKDEDFTFAFIIKLKVLSSKR